MREGREWGGSGEGWKGAPDAGRHHCPPLLDEKSPLFFHVDFRCFFFFPWIPRMYSDCAARVHTSARWFTSLASFDDYDVTSGANLPLFTFNRNQLNLTAIDSYWNQQDNFQFPHQRHRYDIVMTSSNRNPLHYLMVAVQASTAFERSIQFITRV